MITPYPPPAARVELLRVRRVDRTMSVERIRAALQREFNDQSSLDGLRDIDCVEESDEARELEQGNKTAAPSVTNNPTSN